MSNNLKIALQENELVAAELGKVPASASMSRNIGNICIPLATSEAERINKQRTQFLTEQIKNLKE